MGNREGTMRFMRTLFVASAVLVSTAGCTALDAVRWTTPLDTAKDTQTVTDAIAKARQAGSAEHAAVLAGDPVALAQAGEAAGAVEADFRSLRICSRNRFGMFCFREISWMRTTESSS